MPADIRTKAIDIKLEKWLRLSCRAPGDIIKLVMKSLFWFQPFFDLAALVQKPKEICGLYVEVIGPIANWVSGEKAAGGNAKKFTVEKNGDIFFSAFYVWCHFVF